MSTAPTLADLEAQINDLRIELDRVRAERDLYRRSLNKALASQVSDEELERMARECSESDIPFADIVNEVKEIVTKC